MDSVLIVVIVLLCAYPLVIATLIQMYKLALPKKEATVWNVVILALPALGALAFWCVKGKTVFGKKNAQNKSQVIDGQEDMPTKEKAGNAELLRDKERGDGENGGAV